VFHATLAAVSIAIPIFQPTQAQGKYPDGVWIDLRERIDPHGLKLIPGAEGSTELGEMGGVGYVQTNADSKTWYIYFHTPRDFIRPDRDTLTFEVEYLDNGHGPVVLQIDSVLPCIPSGGFNYRAAPAVWRRDTDTWKLARWQIADDAFADAARDGIRFRVFAQGWEGNDPVCISWVRVSHEAILMEPASDVVLCGQTVPVTLSACNRAGDPLPDGTQVALSCDPASPAAVDAPTASLAGGEAEFNVMAGDEPGTAWIAASAGDVSASAPLHVLAGDGAVAEQTVLVEPAEVTAQFAPENVADSSVTLGTDDHGQDVLRCTFSMKPQAQAQFATLTLGVPIPGLPRRFRAFVGSDDESVDSLMLDLVDRDGEVFAYVLDPFGFGTLKPYMELGLDCRAFSYATFGTPDRNGIIDLPCSLRSMRARVTEACPESHLTIWGCQFDVVAPTDAEASPQATAAEHYERGIQLKAAGRMAEAAEELRAAIQADPAHVEAHFALAWVLIETGDRQAAAAEFRKVIELAPDSERAAESQKALERLER
jgi:hypothetical protein